MPSGKKDIKRTRIKRSVELKLPIKSISTNKLYAGRKNRSWFYKKYRRQIFEYLKDNYKESVNLEGNLTVDISVGFSSPLCDLDNSLKGVLDCIAEYYKFNDRQIVKIVAQKYLVNKGCEFTNITIKKSRMKIDLRQAYRKKKEAA